MFQGLRGRLLGYYLMVMAIILIIFSAIVYFSFSQSLYDELEKKLKALTIVATPSLAGVKHDGSQFLQQEEQARWLALFNQKRESLDPSEEPKTIEWFNAEGHLLASQGILKLRFSPTKVGSSTLKQRQIQMYTLEVYDESSNPHQPLLTGYIRISQSTADLGEVQSQLLGNLVKGIALTLGFLGLGGLWLTQKSIEPIKQSLEKLQRFTHDASHELRGPLTAIQASIDVMRNHPERIHAKDVKKVNAIAAATTHMTQLTEDLLYLARTDEASSNLTREWSFLYLPEMLQNLIDLLDPLAQDKEIKLEYYPLAQVSTLGQKAQLTRLFANLLENALQYTPRGGKVILRVAQQSHWAVISVEDTGIGIAQENLPFVFERFWREDKARSRREGGTGLGLSISQAIAQQHGGRITVTSQVGRGSCFTVYLPIGGKVA